MALPLVPVDELPDGTKYSDAGCQADAYGDGHPSCLACPLPACKYDGQPVVRAERHAARYRRVFELRKGGVPVPELCRQFKISTRTIRRIMAAGGVLLGATADTDEVVA